MCDYDFDTDRPTYSSITGHFTQMVWKNSRQLGVGVATGTNRRYGLECTYVVARYRRHGNVLGQFSENVLKGAFDESFCDNAIHYDESGSGSGNGQGSGRFGVGKKWNRIDSDDRLSASGQGNGSGGNGEDEENRK